MRAVGLGSPSKGSYFSATDGSETVCPRREMPYLLRRINHALDSVVDRVLERLVPKVDQQWGCLIPAYVTWAVVLLIPLVLRWVPLWYYFLDLLLVVLSAALGAAYLAALIRAAQRRHLLEWTSNLRLLDPNEFEWLLFELFLREGYNVQKIGSQHHGDGNIDLDIRKGGERIIAQCKRWTARYIPPEEVQRFAGTFPAHGNVTERWFVTLSDFTDDARTAAERSGVVLIDGAQLIDRLQSVRKTEPCPICATPMLLDLSVHGWWLRCPRYPHCPGKRDLSREPGRAVDLLLDQPEATR